MLLKKGDSVIDNISELLISEGNRFPRIYLVKEDTALRGDTENWILMDQDAFLLFLKTEDGKNRENNFAQLDACEKNDFIIVAECGSDQAALWRRERDRQRSIRARNESSGFQIVRTSMENDSLECPCRESWLKDEHTYEGDSMENYVLNHVLADDLHRQIGSLPDDEQKLIYDVYFYNKTVSEYARENDMDINRAFYLKGKILNKLRNALEIRDKTYEKDCNSSGRSGFHYDARNRETLGGAYEK